VKKRDDNRTDAVHTRLNTDYLIRATTAYILGCQILFSWYYAPESCLKVPWTLVTTRISICEYTVQEVVEIILQLVCWVLGQQFTEQKQACYNILYSTLDLATLRPRHRWEDSIKMDPE
jgi:hypothetical protein